jgi:hypothetical protein
MEVTCVTRFLLLFIGVVIGSALLAASFMGAPINLPSLPRFNP